MFIVCFFYILIYYIIYKNCICFVRIVFVCVIVLIDNYWILDIIYLDIVECYIRNGFGFILLCFDLYIIVGKFDE